MTRINLSGDCSKHCFRTDHNHARLINNRRLAAHEKHGENSIEALPAGDPRWLAVLIEEVGEVAHALTYDADLLATDLADELLDVMAVCSAWLDAWRYEGVLPDPRGAWLP